MAAFLLIQTNPGYADQLARFIAGLPGVESVAVTSGPYDVVVEVCDQADQQAAVSAAVRSEPGLAHVWVCR